MGLEGRVRLGVVLLVLYSVLWTVPIKGKKKIEPLGP